MNKNDANYLDSLKDIEKLMTAESNTANGKN